MELPSGDVIQYEYNSEGIREKKINPDGSEVRYLMDGLAVLCEYDGGLNILREYVPGVSMKTNGTSYYYITDRLGNVRYVLDESGGVVQSYLYSPFGQIHSSSGSLSQPYQYVGGEFYYTEDTTGLQLLGQRWYDGEVGRFISRDPLPIFLQDYTYVSNNPVIHTDVFGLFISSWFINENYRKFFTNFFTFINPSSWICLIGKIKEVYSIQDWKDDSFAHCYVSCEVSKECPGGKRFAEYAGFFHEFLSFYGYWVRSWFAKEGHKNYMEKWEEDTIYDFVANLEGRECAEDCYESCKKFYPD